MGLCFSKKNYYDKYNYIGYSPEFSNDDSEESKIERPLLEAPGLHFITHRELTLSREMKTYNIHSSTHNELTLPHKIELPIFENITLEHMAIYFKKNFTNTSSKNIIRYSQKIKQHIIETFPTTFNHSFKLSIPYKVDKWTKLPQHKHYGIYIVIGKLENKNSRCRLRYLLYINKEKILIIEKNINERKVKPSDIIS